MDFGINIETTITEISKTNVPLYFIPQSTLDSAKPQKGSAEPEKPNKMMGMFDFKKIGGGKLPAKK